MYSDRLLIWSVRGLNGRARHDVVADYVLQERVCLRETKLTVIDDSLIVNILGSSFAYSYLSAVGIRGILQRWVNWMSNLFSTASTRILLNGTPGGRVSVMPGACARVTHCRRRFLSSQWMSSIPYLNTQITLGCSLPSSLRL
jgi:hypothetical protein